MADETPHMHPPKVKYEVNINTIVQIVGFVGLAVTIGVNWGTTQSTLSEMGRRDIAHETRLSAQQIEINRIENLAYRVTVLEQASLATSKSLEDLKTAVTSQGADLRVIREILTRLDQQISRSNVPQGN